NADAAQVLADVLATSGHTVRVAGEGPRALEILDRFAADVALLDIGLPVMDGYELARLIRARPGKTPHLIAVTGYGQDSDRVRSTDAGFEAHVVKPFQPVALQSLIENLARRGLDERK